MYFTITPYLKYINDKKLIYLNELNELIINPLSSPDIVHTLR